MRRAFVACGVVAAATALWTAGFSTGPAPASQPSRAPQAYETLVLNAPGGDSTCRVRKSGIGPMAHLIADNRCEALMTGLSKVRYWTENADGSIELSIDGGAALVAFAVADGAGYESFEPRSAIISLEAEE